MQLKEEVAGGWTNAQLRRLLLDQIKDEMN